MPTSWCSPIPTSHDFLPYRFREIFVKDSKMANFKFSSKDEPSHTTRKGFIEGSIPTVDKDKVESSGHTPEDSLAVASDNNSDSGDGCDSVVPVSKEPKNGTTSPHVRRSSIVSISPKLPGPSKQEVVAIIISVLCFQSVTGISPQMDCWDKQSNCSRYKDNPYCNPDIDKDISDRVSWLLKNCQYTCICHNLSVQASKDKTPAYCKEYQYDKECLQRPPSYVLRNYCPSTCYYSKTPHLGDFQTSPKDKTFKEGMNVSLECSIKNANPRVDFTWYWNDVPIGPGKRVSVDSNSSASNLTIMGAGLSDEGEYHCRATNRDYGQELSANSSVGILSIEKGPNTSLIIGLVLGGLLFLVVVVVVVVVFLVVWKVLKSRKSKENNNGYSLAALKETETPIIP